jgi:hypothetical protein
VRLKSGGKLALLIGVREQAVFEGTHHLIVQSRRREVPTKIAAAGSNETRNDRDALGSVGE